MKWSLILVMVLCLSVSASELTIAHLADTHFGLSEAVNQRAENVLKYANGQADVMIIAGDITESLNYKTFSDANKALELVEIPCCLIRGNHDSFYSYERYFGESQYYDDINEYRLIGIDTENVNFDLLEQWLAEAENQTVIVFGHKPVKFGRNCPKAQQLRTLFWAYGVLAYLSGHDHKAKLKEDTLLLGHTRFTTVLIGAGAAKCGKFNLIKLKDGGIESVTGLGIEEMLEK